MANTFTWPPWPESDIDHYNVYRYNSVGHIWTKIGQTAQGVGPLLSFTDSAGTLTDIYHIASADAGQNESFTSVDFVPSDLVGRTRLFGRFLDMAGRAIPRLQVSVALSIQQAFFHGSYVQRNSDAFADDNGNWYVDLVPNVNLIPAGTVYRILISGGLGGPSVDLVIPPGATIAYYPSLITLSLP